MSKTKSDQKLYRNSGVSPLVFEDQTMEPGSEFRATLEPEQEMQLLSGGHIEVLEDQSTKADVAQAEAAESGEPVPGATVENADTTESPRRRRNAS